MLGSFCPLVLVLGEVEALHYSSTTSTTITAVLCDWLCPALVCPWGTLQLLLGAVKCFAPPPPPPYRRLASCPLGLLVSSSAGTTSVVVLSGENLFLLE